MRLLARSPDDRYPTATRPRLRSWKRAPTTVRRPATQRSSSRALRAGLAVGRDRGRNRPPAAAAHRPAHPAGNSGGPGPQAPVRFAETERRWLVPTLLVVLVAVALGVAGLLIQGSVPTSSATPTTSPTPPRQPRRPTSSSPSPGRSTSTRRAATASTREAERGGAIDGNQNTSWSTEDYDPRTGDAWCPASA